MRETPYIQKILLKDSDLVSSIDYPFNIPAVREIESIDFHPNITFFVGENGSGKSTVLESVAGCLGFNAEGGSWNAMFETLPKAKNGYFLRAESFYNVATYMEELGFSGSFHDCSHGEAFMSLLTKTFKENGIYILDEPEAALSPQRQMSAICAIHDLVCKGSQFIIVTHSPILLKSLK